MQVRSRCFRPERCMKIRLKVWSLETRAPERDSHVRPAREQQQQAGAGEQATQQMIERESEWLHVPQYGRAIGGRCM